MSLRSHRVTRRFWIRVLTLLIIAAIIAALAAYAPEGTSSAMPDEVPGLIQG